MYDFKDSISLERLKENINNNENFQRYAELFFYDIYYKILEYSTLNGYLDKAISIQNEYYDNIMMFSISNYEKDKFNFERNVM